MNLLAKTVLTLSVLFCGLASGQTVRFSAQAFDESGTNEIGFLREGERFLVKILAEDLQDDPAGVFAAYVDVLFDAERLSVVQDPVFPVPSCVGLEPSRNSLISHAKPYTCGISDPTFPAPGRMDATGGFTEVFQSTLGRGPFEVMSFFMQAESPGEAFVTPESTSDPNDPFDENQSAEFGALVYGQDDFVCPNEATCFGLAQYVGDSVTIFRCDFDGDGVSGLSDVNQLMASIAAQDNNQLFDVNGDGGVNQDDLTAWLDCKETWLGDANLDGEFNSRDLVAVFQVAEYEDDIAGNSGWGDGDWNADGDFNSGDLVAAFQQGGYELGPRSDVSSVPEPAGLAGLAWAAVWMLRCRRRTPATSMSIS